MAIHPLAGKPAPADLLIDPAKLRKEYYDCRPDPGDPGQQVVFGTSGHRGTPDDGTFTEAHILAIAQAICDYRRGHAIDGPVFVGKDTHALSGPAQETVLEVLAGNKTETRIQPGDRATPIPAVSRAIIRYNGRYNTSHNDSGPKAHADGIIISPSHNPPADGGIKYNPPNGGPADTDVTAWIEGRANELLRAGNGAVKRMPPAAAKRAATTREYDFVIPYVRELGQAIDMEAIRSAGLRLGADPLGGAALDYWAPIREIYGLNIEVVNTKLDPAFGFMTVDHDGKIRMDCSSPYAMAKLVEWKDRFDVSFGNDPDADRHGIVTPSAGLMNPNHYLAAAIRYLLTHRPAWMREAAVGKTLVSSGMIDRVVESEKRRLCEVPVGFKWFAQELFDGSLCFGGEESAGASFLQMDGSVWTTDKDGPLMDLLAAEITATTGKDPGKHYEELTARFGTPAYRRVDLPATREQKELLKKLGPEAITEKEMAGEAILAALTRAPGNGASIGGLKVVTKSGWFAARPSGTENILKIYAESFQGAAHLEAILQEAREIVSRALAVVPD
ncbi:MAG TPA: phosphoglucomutase (alpha-D-glucose-1,6-bisphosphate-dependent) [Candidatus Dormibacteraeota bacterium]|nr:phosphoglucomutase (alpha-D-glucose-1,6-bisphosphate-dependent) [Candidatus Dormibacteraeota bacterium]